MAGENKRCLGDSVYVEFENGMLKLTTDNGLGADNTIYLEPEVYAELKKYVEDLPNQIGKSEKDVAKQEKSC